MLAGMDEVVVARKVIEQGAGDGGDGGVDFDWSMVSGLRRGKRKTVDGSQRGWVSPIPRMGAATIMVVDKGYVAFLGWG
ncbi:leucine-rich repeat extensin-like protein 7 [Iris pallida]|uniref:Leucine-rich repeat extensin-like protein 7 n=1 Tax=Iris pallida TaxID=29817 RepID=A0AAX6DRI8_IRIPA|nr:leucine-rich repeat extensin-like protein 7 [Iris pallida]